jgi:hypothetical protein
VKTLLLRLPWIAAALFVAASVFWMARDTRIPHEAFQEYSIFNSSAKGMSLASRYLGARGREVKALARSVDRAYLPPDAVLFRIRPGVTDTTWKPDDKALNLRPILAFDSKDPGKYPFTPEEEDWVRAGGRLILAIDRDYGGIGIQPKVSGPPHRVFPLLPGVEKLDPAPLRGLDGWVSREGIAIFAGDEAPVLSLVKKGKGEIYVCSAPELFQNGRLSLADHLGLLEQLAGRGRPVYFDEYGHGIDQGAGTAEILSRWGFGPLLLFLFVAALASFWRRRLRIGPEEDDARETRIEAVDFVDSLALLYTRMLTRRHVIAMYARAFHQAASVQTGLRGAALDARVNELMPNRPALSAKGRDLAAAEFTRELEAINDAFGRLDDAKRSGRGRQTVAGAGRT